jgi:gamma-polyglutamate biosynthesis protein CapA
MIKRFGFLTFLALLFSAAIFIGITNQQNTIEGGRVLGELVSPETDSMGQVFTDAAPVVSKKTSLSFIAGGDLMFDRYIRQVANESGYEYILEELSEFLKQVDFVVGNLEGPVTDSSSISMYSEFGSYENYIFTFDSTVVKILKEYKFLVSLGNNHILNFGQDGLSKTLEYLDKGEVEYFGQAGRETVKSYLVYEKNDLKIGLVNYNQFIDGGKQEVLDMITNFKDEVDFVVVYTHWGNEYTTRAGEVIEELAHEFVDMGADLVIGSHPHVVQQVEEYKGKKIYYSLGNFVFDQYFSEDTMKGLLVRVDIEKESGQDLKTMYKEVPIKLLPSGKSVLRD